MPELPEVEYVARQLRRELVGQRFAEVRVLWPRSVAGMEPPDFEARLVGRAVVEIGRRAKFLLLGLDDGQVVVIHRRMSGNLVFLPLDDPDRHARVEFRLEDGRRLVFSDPRKFGRLLLARSEELPALFARLGPEPLEAAFTPAVLAERLAGRRGALKALLLDQSIVAGLGNIYADESLFRAGIHPLRAGDSLSGEEIARLHAGIQGALLTGIEHGGTSFDRHRDLYNEAGSNLEHVEVYRHTGEPCPRCGTPIARITVAQRGTHFCPRCQPVAPVRAAASAG